MDLIPQNHVGDGGGTGQESRWRVPPMSIQTTHEDSSSASPLALLSIRPYGAHRPKQPRQPRIRKTSRPSPAPNTHYPRTRLCWRLVLNSVRSLYSPRRRSNRNKPAGLTHSPNGRRIDFRITVLRSHFRK